MTTDNGTGTAAFTARQCSTNPMRYCNCATADCDNGTGPTFGAKPLQGGTFTKICMHGWGGCDCSRDVCKRSVDISYLSGPAVRGWLCPKCGRGNSPYTSTCLCVPIEFKVTC